jgi:hypothetical protein
MSVCFYTRPIYHASVLLHGSLLSYQRASGWYPGNIQFLLDVSQKHVGMRHLLVNPRYTR